MVTHPLVADVEHRGNACRAEVGRCRPRRCEQLDDTLRDRINHLSVVRVPLGLACHLTDEEARHAHLAPRTPGRGLRSAVVLSVDQAASSVGRSPETVRRWIRGGRLSAIRDGGWILIDRAELDAVRDELYPMLPLPPQWRLLEDGTPAPNWVAALALSRSGR